MERNLTTGSVLKNIIFFSLPYLLSYFLQTLYGMADLYIIGQFDGVSATTSVSIGSQVMHMITVIIVGLAMGTTVTIGQAVGGDDKKKVSTAIGNTALLFVCVAIVMTVILLALTDSIVSVLSTPAEAVEGTKAYLTVCFIGIPFITAYNIISSIFRGMGDSKSPMYFIAIACVVNILIDYILIGYFNFGPVGAALGTTISQAFSVAVALFVIVKKNTGIKLSISDLKPKPEIMSKILIIGSPIALQDGLIQVAFMVITVIANLRGLNDAAAVGIVEKIISFVFLVPSSMLSTVSALSAQNIGAKKYDRASLTLKYATIIATTFGIIVAISVQFMPEAIVGLFTNDAEVTVMGGQYLRGYIWDCIFAGIHFSFSGYFCACGRSEISFIHNMIAIVTIRIPLVYIMSKMFADTLLPMGLATSLGSLVSVIVCIVAYIWLQKNNKAVRI